jgi:hypothetical protein
VDCSGRSLALNARCLPLNISNFIEILLVYSSLGCSRVLSDLKSGSGFIKFVRGIDCATLYDHAAKI